MRISDWSSDVCSSDLQKKLMSIILDDVQRLDRLISDISDASRLDAELSRAETDTVELGELLHALVEVQEAGERVDGPCFRLDVSTIRTLLCPGSRAASARCSATSSATL